MTRLSGSNLAIDLPSGWEGRIATRVGGGALLHAGNFALPAEIADYGGGAVELMARGHMFVSLMEFGRESVGTALFERQGKPSGIGNDAYAPGHCVRGLPGHTGAQTFFTEAGRAFALYVVLGSHAMRATMTPEVNRVLRAITIS